MLGLSRTNVLLAAVALVATACSSEPGDGMTSGTSDGTGGDGDGATMTSGDGDGATTMGTSTATGDGDAGTTAGDGDGTTGSTTGDGDGPTPTLPPFSGTCPTIVDGTVSFAPAAIPAREVRVWISSAADTMDGPVVFYWHGTSSSPLEAPFGLTQGVINDILARGGVVVAPTAAPDAGQFPWFVVNGSPRQDDFTLANEIVGCLEAQVGIDDRRIHSTGMSAGGLQTSQFAHRAPYIASAASYSGGIFTTAASADPTNKFAAMIIHGGPTDEYGGFVQFDQTSQAWYDQLVGAGHFAFQCDHGSGHSIPQGGANMGADIWAFFDAHPYGTDPSPWSGGLPGGFSPFCSL